MYVYSNKSNRARSLDLLQKLNIEQVTETVQLHLAIL